MSYNFLYLSFFRRGFLKAICPVVKKEHQRIRQAFHPIPVNDLSTEYLIRHKDSDFLFNAEFEALPRAKTLPHTASERPENKCKNRYNDIKACDLTRVKLSVQREMPATDYINGNFIKVRRDNHYTVYGVVGPFYYKNLMYLKAIQIKRITVIYLFYFRVTTTPRPSSLPRVH